MCTLHLQIVITFFYESMIIYVLDLVANILTTSFISHSVPYNPQKNMQTAWHNPMAITKDQEGRPLSEKASTDH